jgi:hypothetical protein
MGAIFSMPIDRGAFLLVGWCTLSRDYTFVFEGTMK